MQTLSEISALPENSAARITVQRITEVINRRRKTFAFEGEGTAGAVADIRCKIAGAAPVANSQLPKRCSAPGTARGELLDQAGAVVGVNPLSADQFVIWQFFQAKKELLFAKMEHKTRLQILRWGLCFS